MQTSRRCERARIRGGAAAAYRHAVALALTAGFALAGPVHAQAPLVDLLADPDAGVVAEADEFVRARVRVETIAARRAVFAGETLATGVRIWIERDFAAQNLLQISARQLDVPVQVLAPWLERGATPPPAGAASVKLALGEQVVDARRLEAREFEGRTYLGFEAPCRVLVERAGELRLEAPQVRLAYATHFRSTLLTDREPGDSKVALVAGEPLSFDVEALPDAGRPLDFAGAIGVFELSATVDRDEVRVGETFRLTLAIRGEGNFGRFEPPRLDRLADFRLVGRLARLGADELAVTYDLAPTSRRVFETPRVEMPYFDPRAPASYNVATAAALPLRVSRADGSPRGATSPTNAPNEMPGMRAARSMFVLVAVLVATALALVVGVALWVVRARRARKP
jgi:hypothetical protein